MSEADNGHTANNLSKGVSVSILDKEFVIACPKSAENSLKASANYLDVQMRKIRQTGRVVGIERIAVMAALNISHELLTRQLPQQTEATQGVDDLKERLGILNQKIDRVLLDTTMSHKKATRLTEEKINPETELELEY